MYDVEIAQTLGDIAMKLDTIGEKLDTLNSTMQANIESVDAVSEVAVVIADAMEDMKAMFAAYAGASNGPEASTE